MSGYNPHTGIFELGWSKVRHYLRTPIDRTISANTELQYVAELLRRQGFNVIKVDEYCVYVVADDAQIWTVLSGQPATWGKAVIPAAEAYAKYEATREWFNATDIGRALSPVLSAVKVNQLLAKHGYQTKKNGFWEVTKKANGLYRTVGARNEYAWLNKLPEHGVIRWHRSVIDIISTTK